MKYLWVYAVIFLALAGALVLSGVVWDKNWSNWAWGSASVSLEAPQINPISLPAYMVREYDGRDLKLGSILAKNEFYTRYFITYKSGALTVSGIMNVPNSNSPAGGFPVLILNHGYIDPAIYTNGRGLKREQDYLARRGYAVVHSDYRNHALSGKDPDADMKFRLGYVEDVINAVYAVKNSDLAYLNKEKIGMLGHSMGGGVAINFLVTQPNLVKVAVLFAPVSADWQDNFEKWTSHRLELTQKLVAAYGSPQTSPEFWKNISAINFLDKIQTPIMVHHGDRDESVPIAWSDKLAGKLKENQKEVTYYTYSGEPHEFAWAWPLVMQRTADFFDRYLK